VASFFNLTIFTICIFYQTFRLSHSCCFYSIYFLFSMEKKYAEPFYKLSYHTFCSIYCLESLQSGAIICGIESLESSVNLPQIRLEIKFTLLQLLFFIIDNPIYFIELSFHKMIYFWSTYRSGYSTLHNISSILFFSPVYVLAILGWWKCKIPTAIKIYLSTFLGLTCFLVIITCVNWDSRFLAPALPFVFVLSGLGFGNIFRTFKL